MRWQLIGNLKGAEGQPGKNAEPVDIARVVAEVIAQIPTPKDGRDGVDGKDFDPAVIRAEVAKAVDEIPKPKDIQPEVVAALVATEVSKAVAAMPVPANGRDGRDGLAGDPGRDAWQIEVLESIDPQRKYQRGTYAKWRGGEIRSFRATDPLVDGDLEKAGWTISREGIAAIELEDGGDLRTFGLKVVMTSGQSVVLTKQMPVLLDQKVYRADKEYARGDVVSYGGSMWIADIDKPSHKPGELNKTDWRLSVKCGRDGKDGLQGKQGEPGRPGRDLTPFAERA